jgi:hypothetical protein
MLLARLVFMDVEGPVFGWFSVLFGKSGAVSKTAPVKVDLRISKED